MQFPIPPREADRLAELRAYGVLDTPPEPDFDDIVALAAMICGVPVALITLVDEKRQWFKSRRGMEPTETPREVAFCAHAIGRPAEVMVVNDATRDPRFADNPFVTGREGIRFYAGAPLVTPSGHALGTLCVLDHRPRELDAGQLHALETLSRHVMVQLQLRRQNVELRRLEGEQRRLAERLIDAQAVARVGSWETDLATLEVTWTTETHRIFGTTPETFRPTHEGFLALVHPADRAAVDEAFAASLGAAGPGFIEHRVCRPNGEERVVQERWQVFRDAAGTPARAVGTSRDITESRGVWERLRENEERFRLLARAAADAVWDWDLRSDQVWWNEGYETLFGRRRDAVDHSSRSWTEFIHPDDRERVARSIHAVIDGGGAEWADEYRFLHADGHYLEVADRGEVIRDAAGRAVRMVGGMTDLTARKQSDKKLREQAAFLDKARDAIIARDLEHRITYWNKSAERLYGWPAAEAIGRSAREILYVDPTVFDRAMQSLLTQGEWVGELVQVRRSGEKVEVEGRWTLVRDEEGRPASILAINTDITERKQLEQQFLRAQRLESIGTLAGGIAHDLNNLLSPITLGVELLRRREVDPANLGIIDNIERSARRGSNLVRQMLSFARGAGGTRRPLHMQGVVREIEAIIANTFPKNVRLETVLPPELWPVLGDATQLNQVMLNLCVNARDAMPDGGLLQIKARNLEADAHYATMHGGLAEGRYVVLTVADTGTGIPPEILERIFDPFFTTKGVGQGTGLGLSSVLGIVRGHGGAVTVESVVGRGTSFHVHLPAQPDAAPVASGDPFGAAILRGSGELILVVDDEAPVLSVMRQTLEEFGYRTVTAEDGAQAIALFASNQAEIALVVTDMMMPVMDGAALILALRRLNPGIGIIGVSGLAEGGMAARADEAGVSRVLRKPFTAPELLRAIQQLLAGRAGGVGPG